MREFLRLSFWAFLYAMSFGSIASWGIFYLYGEETNSLLYLISLVLFAFIGFSVFSLFVFYKSHAEVDDVLEFDRKLLEGRIKELESDIKYLAEKVVNLEENNG
tara:strand:+ start:508 stop:819 length:312 start_codon:yes stop_codon:yes gene_type:complete